MFNTLAERRACGTTPTRTITIATLVHALVIATAVSSTKSHQLDSPSPARDTVLFGLTLVPQPPPPASGNIPRAPGNGIIPAPSIPEIIPGAPDFRLPPLSLLPHAAAATASAVQGNLGNESPQPAFPAFPARVPGAGEVDELPQLVNELRPRYPEQLRRQGVSGLVLVEYVVDTSGRVDARTVRVRATSHPAFQLAALQALRAARFRPARRAGRSVAVLVQQTIRFQVQ